MGACSSVSNSRILMPNKIVKNDAGYHQDKQADSNPPKNRSKVEPPKKNKIHDSNKFVLVSKGMVKKSKACNSYARTSQVISLPYKGRVKMRLDLAGVPNHGDPTTLREISLNGSQDLRFDLGTGKEEKQAAEEETYYLMNEKSGISRLVPVLNEEISKSSIFSRRKIQQNNQINELIATYIRNIDFEATPGSCAKSTVASSRIPLDLTFKMQNGSNSKISNNNQLSTENKRDFLKTERSML